MDKCKNELNSWLTDDGHKVNVQYKWLLLDQMDGLAALTSRLHASLLNCHQRITWQFN